MPYSILSLKQRIVSVVQPICHKSADHDDTIDDLYHKLVRIIFEAAKANEAGDTSKWEEAQNHKFIDAKATVMDTLKELQKIAIDRQTLKFKYKADDLSKPTDKSLNQQDLAIIEDFLTRLPEAYALEASQHDLETPKK